MAPNQSGPQRVDYNEDTTAGGAGGDQGGDQGGATGGAQGQGTGGTQGGGAGDELSGNPGERPFKPNAPFPENLRASTQRSERAGRFIIRTPNAGFRGERAGVKFFDGVGYTDSEEKARELYDLGYQVSVNE